MPIEQEPNLIPFTPLYTVESGLKQGFPVRSILAEGINNGENIYDMMTTLSLHNYFVQHYVLPYNLTGNILLVRISLNPVPHELTIRHRQLSQELSYLNSFYPIDDLGSKIKQLPSYLEMQRLPAAEIIYEVNSSYSL